MPLVKHIGHNTIIDADRYPFCEDAFAGELTGHATEQVVTRRRGTRLHGTRRTRATQHTAKRIVGVGGLDAIDVGEARDLVQDVVLPVLTLGASAGGRQDAGEGRTRRARDLRGIADALRKVARFVVDVLGDVTLTIERTDELAAGTLATKLRGTMVLSCMRRGMAPAAWACPGWN